MTPELIIFDCDGVLVDTEHIVDDIVAASLTRHGLPITPKESSHLFTGGTIMGVEAEARARGADLPQNWIDQIYAEMFAQIERGVEVIPGVLDFIDRAENHNIQMAIASNGPMEKMRRSLGPSGLWDRFAGRIYSREDHAPKPAPDMLIHAMKQAQVERRATVMIDDSPSGCRAARNADIRCIGYATEGQDERLIAEGATPLNSMIKIAEEFGL